MMPPVLRAKDIHFAAILRGDVTVNEQELAVLQGKARAHDGYLRATRRMRAEVLPGLEGPPEQVKGWLDCLDTFARLVLEEI